MLKSKATNKSQFSGLKSILHARIDFYPFAVGILRRLVPFIAVDKFGIRIRINFEIKKYIFLNSDSCSQCVI